MLKFLKYLWLCTALLLYGMTGVAQGNKDFGIINPNFEKQGECKSCLQFMNELPVEVQYGVANIEGELFFVINDRRYFEKLIKENTDGLALDIVPRSHYACGKSVPKHQIAKGQMFKPMYRKDILKNTRLDEREIVYVKLADLPDDMEPDQIECNLLFLKKKYLCYYGTFYDIPTHRWNLLEMGLYKDAEMKSVSHVDSILLSKQMKFVIPFEKNKFNYAKKDIQPIYDSLRLTDYNITSINISAYSSVEGPSDNNIRLQHKRAESIIKVFEQLQDNHIPEKVEASENWVEFAEDVRGTKFNFLLTKPKDEIKQRLSEPKLATDIEYILAEHRKAVVILELEKKNVFTKMSTKELKTLFNQKISADQLKEAQEIQQVLFANMDPGVSPDSVAKELEIPEKVEYADLLLDQVAYMHYKADNIYSTIASLQKLQKLFPKNKRIEYNLVALKIKSWSFGDLIVNDKNLWTQIKDLEQYDIPENLLMRLKINYRIIQCEYLMRDRMYEEKNKSLRFIYNNYRKLNFSHKDLLDLAKFFSSYSRYDWSIALLDEEVRKNDVDDDLLFYYLNLTIINPKVVAKPFYQTILLNAIQKDKDRYCNMFATYGYGGITFQLLDNRKLRKFYCQECN